jgi:uncharacterized membrane protein YgdD (TMEM256/DUF423 family)
MNPLAARLAAALGLLTVALGAFGAHALKPLLTQHDMVAVWEKAVWYQGLHAVMLFFLASRKPWPAVAWWSFLIGIILFSGSLYLLALTQIRELGIITPFGGVALLTGWAALLIKPPTDTAKN